MNVDASQRYDEMSVSYDSDRVQSYMMKIRDFVTSWVGTAPVQVVEVGSGTGEYSLALARQGHDVLGLDVSEKMVEMGNHKACSHGLNGCSFMYADAQETIPMVDKADRVLSIDSWECFGNPRGVLKSSRAVLKPDGRMLIITPDNWLFPAFWLAETLRVKKNRPAFEHHNSYPHRIRRLARDTGFTIQSIERLFYGTTLAITLAPHESDG